MFALLCALLFSSHAHAGYSVDIVHDTDPAYQVILITYNNCESHFKVRNDFLYLLDRNSNKNDGYIKDIIYAAKIHSETGCH